MSSQRTTWPCISVLLVLVTWCLCVSVGLTEDKNNAPNQLPPEFVKAWKDAGAEVGWMRVNQNGVFQFQEKGEAGSVPAFRFSEWKEGVLMKLPDPGAAFGLDLNSTQITDEGMKELAGLKDLQMLNLQETPVTDAGLKELARLKVLQSLNLFRTQVTDEGLKELTGLRNLQTLNLQFT